MQKIFNARDTKLLDRETVVRQGISSLDLMERAASAFVQRFEARFDRSLSVLALAGPGNNGGDALAVGRLLAKRGWKCESLLVPVGPLSPDCQANLSRAFRVRFLFSVEELENRREAGIVIDGLLGAGVNRPSSGLMAEVIRTLNQMPARKVSIDLPSGMYPDRPLDHDVFVRSDLTLTFEFPKPALLLPESGNRTGEWETVPIGLSETAKAEIETEFLFLRKSDALSLAKTRRKFSHKGDYGKCLIVAGKKGMAGAAVLAVRAALKAGAGRVTAFVAQVVETVLQASVPEAITLASSETGTIAESAFGLEGYDALLVGPGIGTCAGAERALERFLSDFRLPMVLDADALNLLGKRPELLPELPPNSILTPHPGEFRRLVGDWSDDYDKLERLADFASRANGYVVLKGAHSVVASPEGKFVFNESGNAMMATPGSGDVLAGILAGLLAQGYEPYEAALLGTWLHGNAGDVWLENNPHRRLLAGELLDHLAGFGRESQGNPLDPATAPKDFSGSF